MDPTCIGQGGHTALVVSMGIHVVNTDRIGAQLGHPSDIALALGSVDKWVTWGKLISNSWSESVRRTPLGTGLGES